MGSLHLCVYSMPDETAASNISIFLFPAIKKSSWVHTCFQALQKYYFFSLIGVVRNMHSVSCCDAKLLFPKYQNVLVLSLEAN